MNNRLLILTLTLSCLTTVPVPAFADDATAARIAHARSAAPAFISANATIMESDGTVLHEGTNGWTCLPDTLPGDGAPMCNDATWMALLSAVGGKTEFKPTGVGISYMLQGDRGAGVSNSNPFHHDHASADDYVEVGPHLMIVVPRELLQGISDDPSKGGPFVMWGDTPYAHIMVPIAE
jgi:hypothetical protein